MPEQVEQGRVSIQSIVRRYAFQQGVRDVLANRPAFYDGWEDYVDAYERGRHFAAACKARRIRVPKIRIGQKINPAVIRLYNILQLQDDIR